MMTTYTVQLVLDKRNKKQDDTFPIKFRITLNRKSVYISTGYSVEAAHWNDQKREIKSSARQYLRVRETNNRLLKQKLNIEDLLDQLRDQKQLHTLPLKDIKAYILGQGKTHNLYAYFEQIITQQRKVGKVGNARVYQTALNSIKTYSGDKDFPMKFITYKWLVDYEDWYLARTTKDAKGREKKNTRNGLSVHMRTLRALLNKAIKSNLLSKDSYPFTTYKITNSKTRKRAISAQDILKIKALPEETLTPRQKRAKTYFLMSFYLMGISFIDLAFLQIGNIVQDRIEYIRRKTKREHSIKITQPLWTLLAPYLRGKSNTDYILEIVKGETEEKRYTSVRDEMQRYNKALKQLATMAGIRENISSYTVRHTYATIAKNKGIPISVISEALGHNSVDVTHVYLKSFDAEILDKYNEMIIDDSVKTTL